jgi:hypothetical protein
LFIDEIVIGKYMIITPRLIVRGLEMLVSGFVTGVETEVVDGRSFG